jgi:hypothetical protein
MAALQARVEVVAAHPRFSQRTFDADPSVDDERWHDAHSVGTDAGGILPRANIHALKAARSALSQFHLGLEGTAKWTSGGEELQASRHRGRVGYGPH